MYKLTNRIPEEQWYNLARFLYFDKDDMTSGVGVLEELIQHYPKEQYEHQLENVMNCIRADPECKITTLEHND